MKICNLALVCLDVYVVVLHTAWDPPSCGRCMDWIHIIPRIFLSVIIAWHLLLHYKSRWQNCFPAKPKPKNQDYGEKLILLTLSPTDCNSSLAGRYAHNAHGGIHGNWDWVSNHCRHSLFRYRKFYMNKSKSTPPDLGQGRFICAAMEVEQS